MKVNYTKLRKKHLRERKKIIQRLDAKGRKLKEKAAAQKARENIRPPCSALRARRWNIPKVAAGSLKELLGMPAHCLLPEIPPEGKRRKTGGTVVRLHGFLNSVAFIFVADVVSKTENELIHKKKDSPFRNAGKKTIALLQDCLSWNGLKFGMEIEPGTIDERLTLHPRDFFVDAPAHLRRYFDSDGPSDKVNWFTRVAVFTLWTREDLSKWHHYSDEVLDYIEGKLAEIGRVFRVPEE